MVQKFYKLYKIDGEEFCKRYQNFSKQSLLKAAKKKKKKEKKIILRWSKFKKLLSVIERTSQEQWSCVPLNFMRKKNKKIKKILFNTVKRYFQDLVNFCDQSWITAD